MMSFREASRKLFVDLRLATPRTFPEALSSLPSATMEFRTQNCHRRARWS